MTKKFDVWIYQLSIFIVGALLLLGGLGISVFELKIIGFLITTLLLTVILLLKKKLVIPGFFYIYLIFLFFLFLSIFWSPKKRESFEFLILFISGGTFWLFFANIPKKFTNLFENILVLLGIFFGGLYIRSLFLGEFNLNPYSLYNPIWFFSSHVHLGDFWVVCMIILISRIGINKKKFFYYLPVILLGSFFLLSSSSRSSYIALFFSLFLLIENKKIFRIHIKRFVVFLFIFLAIFLFSVAGRKSLFFDRPYYFQALTGLINAPFGVGGGNFILQSLYPNNRIALNRETSSFAHNIILEMVSSIGVLSLVFIYWLYKELKEIFRKYNKYELNSFIFIFIAITVNFMFDMTYFIPTMVWLWFSALGMSAKVED